MDRALRTTAFACTGAVLLSMGAITSANARYLGYGDGDPGNWDFATEQAGGPCGKGTARAIDPATGQPKCCAQYNPESACPLLRTGSKYDRPTKRLSQD